MTYVLSFSREEAQRLHNDSVTPVHLMLGILRHNSNHARDFLKKLQPDLTQLKSKLENIAHTHQVLVAPAENEMNFNDQATRIMRLSVLEARQMKSDVIDTEHILLAIMRMNDNEASNLLEQMNISYEDVARMVRPQIDTKAGYGFREDEEDEDDDDNMVSSNADSESTSHTSTQTQAKKNSGNTPVLDNFGTDLTRAAAEGLLDPVVGRQKEIERVAQILSRRKKNNPILIGHPGVGKSAIVEGLATRIVKHQISRHLWGKRAHGQKR